MNRLSFALLLLLLSLSAQLGGYQLKRVTLLNSGPRAEFCGRVVCYDSNHDGLMELIFQTAAGPLPTNPLRWEIWEHRPMNRYVLVFADTSQNQVWPFPPGLDRGGMALFDAGDIDRDGRTDLLGETMFRFSDTTRPDSSFYYVVATVESRDSFSYPDTVTWCSQIAATNNLQWYDFHLTDLDRDGKCDIISYASWDTYDSGGIRVYENRGNDTNAIVWHTSAYGGGSNFAVGDFDGDSTMEFATADLGSRGGVYVSKNIGPDQYAEVFTDSLLVPNCLDVFPGHDVDHDGKPEFFVAPCYVGTTFYLYMFESNGQNTYEHTLVATKSLPVSYPTSRRSCCGDVDGDGVEEIIWSCCDELYIYKATGNNQFQQVWQWTQDHGSRQPAILVSVADMNSDGYNEIVVGGSDKTSVFEIEAIRVLNPNTSVSLHPGDTCRISWRTFSPPRCDSVSLFLRTDTSWALDTLIHGLMPGETAWTWTVPDIISDYCHIVAIAYGPGWQYDESDTFFRIVLAGVAEGPRRPLTTQIIGVAPNPLTDHTEVQFQLSTAQTVRLHVCDVSGRTVATLADGVVKPGVYRRDWQVQPSTPNGVYFLNFTVSNYNESRKLILMR